MLSSLFEKFWDKYGITIILIGSAIFIFTVWLLYTRKKKSGTHSGNPFNALQEHLLLSGSIKHISDPIPKYSRKGPPKESKGERKCREVLENVLFPGYYFPNQRPNFMKNSVTGENLELDMYNEQLQLAVEYNGKQHYEYIPFFHNNSKDNFRTQQYRDLMTKDLCVKNNIHLIEVPYTVKLENIEKYIKNECKKIGYNI
jgi:hypothetical protein